MATIFTNSSEQVEYIAPFGHHIDGGDLVVAREQRGDAQTDVAGAGHGYFEVVEGTHWV